MSLFKITWPNSKGSNDNSENGFADSSTINPNERHCYAPDSYYTLNSHPGSIFEKKVVLFSERKKTTISSRHGLYPAEIMLLQYCTYGNYPNPTRYPSFWWFEYGIRDVGHALESLEKRGFLTRNCEIEILQHISFADLKKLLPESKVKGVRKKNELIAVAQSCFEEIEEPISKIYYKYKLTELGTKELSENYYIIYMHTHPWKTIESPICGKEFNLWAIQKCLKENKNSNAAEIIGTMEESLFGINMYAVFANGGPKHKNEIEMLTQGKKLRDCIVSNSNYLESEINGVLPTSTFEIRAKAYDRIEDDFNALLLYLVAIGKNTIIPETYKRACEILINYGLLDEYEVIYRQAKERLDCSAMKYIDSSRKIKELNK